MVTRKIFDDTIFDGNQATGNFIFDTAAAIPTKGNIVIATADFDPLPIEATVGA